LEKIGSSTIRVFY